jgi:hypothetical protein
MRKTHIVSLACLQRASLRVAAELSQHGLWTERLQTVPVTLVPVGACYGWHSYDGVGRISIPCVSLLKLRDLLCGSYTGVADVVRHEYAHAIANMHRGLFRSRYFSEAYGRPHDSIVRVRYDPDQHVSHYAATAAAEDFAETFMIYLRRGGHEPRYFPPAIKRKWRFISALCRAIQAGRTRW